MDLDSATVSIKVKHYSLHIYSDNQMPPFNLGAIQLHSANLDGHSPWNFILSIKLDGTASTHAGIDPAKFEIYTERSWSSFEPIMKHLDAGKPMVANFGTVDGVEKVWLTPEFD